MLRQAWLLSGQAWLRPRPLLLWSAPCESLPGPSTPAGGSLEPQGLADLGWGGLEAGLPWHIQLRPFSPFDSAPRQWQHFFVGHRPCLGMSQKKWHLSSILKHVEFFRR